MLLPLFGLLVGILLGLLLQVKIPVVYVKYLGVAIVAAFDTILGGLRATFEKKFDDKLFITGFFGNSLLAALLAAVGDRIGVDLYLAAVVAFGIRIFQNLAIIRRYIFRSM